MEDTELLLLRHFPSVWNDPKERKFAGWMDVALAKGSFEQGIAVGRDLRRHGFLPERYFVSTLQRARQSLNAVVEGLNDHSPVVDADWRLNERNYGVLQGMRHEDAKRIYGEEQVHRWRRDYKEQPPQGESLEQTRVRVAEFWHDRIVPEVRQGRRTLIVAHGNSLRALMMELAQMSEAEIEDYEIPTGKPFLCRLRTDNLALLSRSYLDWFEYLS